jgi:DNA polymerase III delta prime subunit
MSDGGSVSGDVVGGDKIVNTTAGGDIVGGHKVTQTGSGNIFTGAGNVLVVQPQLSPAGTRERANLLQLLRKVKTFWIESVLERSLHQAYLLELGLNLRAEAVDHPWANVLEMPNASRPIPAGTPISQVFEDANRALLILGEPGAGKTTTLLELARTLIQRAEADAEGMQPVPVVFNLSSWRRLRRPLDVWMASELASKYQVPTRLGHAWLSDQRLLPLLDGLDEVDPLWQAACVRAINTYTERQGLPGLVVCSRLEEYTRLPVRLRLNAAISLSPLSPDQVSAYLQSGGERLAALREVMAGDELLAALARTPLFLSIMSLAYQDLQPEALAGPELNSLDERRRHLFGHYVTRMLKRKGQSPNRFSDAVLLNWTGWLARQMAAHQQTVFLVERMQPSWISGQLGRWIYALASRVVGWTLFGAVFAAGLIIFATTFTTQAHDLAQFAATNLSPASLFSALDLGWRFAGRFTLIGLVAGLICGARFAWNTRRGAAPGGGQPEWWTPALNMLGGSILPPMVVLAPRLIGSFTAAGASLINIIVGLALVDLPAIFLAAIAFRTRVSGESTFRDIATVDALNWSWVQSFKWARLGFVAGGVLGSVCALTFMPSLDPVALLVILLAAIPPGMVVGAALGLLAGLRARALEGTPASGQWVLRHARSALAAGLMVGAGLGLCGAVSMAAPAIIGLISGVEVFPDIVFALGIGLVCALVFGAVGVFYYGGFSLLQHVTLRLILIAQRRIPWRLAQIANQAEDLAFLRRVGTGYIFIHRLVLEHFASLPEA